MQRTAGQGAIMEAQGLLNIVFGPVDAPTVVAGPPPVRHFYRCCDCLSVVAVEGERGRQPIAVGVDTYGRSTGRPAGKCGACNGSIEYMGEVIRTVLEKVTGYRSVCDFRCTHATGPNCDCRCGGANHGSGAVVEVREVSGVPTLAVKPGARHVGEYWRAACARFREAYQARYGYVTGRKSAGAYLDATEWGLYREGGRLMDRYREVREGRTAARGRKLEALIAEVQGKIGGTV